MKQSLYILIAFSLFLAACSESNIPKTQKSEVAEAGIQIIDYTKELYNEYKHSTHSFEYKAKHLNILTGNSAFPGTTFSEKHTEEQKQIRKVQSLIASYNNLYRSFYKMVGLQLNKDKSGFQQTALVCVRRFQKFENKEKEANKKKQNENYLSEKEINAYQLSPFDVMYKLNTQFSDFIKNDIEQRNKYSEDFYDKYSEGLKKVPAYKFDSLKLVQEVSEPYSNKLVLVKLYKLKMDEEIYQHVDMLLNQANKIVLLIDELNILHAEYLKRNKSRKEIDRRLTKINEHTVAE